MNAKRLIKRALKSEYPISRALAILEYESRRSPKIRELVKAVYEVYIQFTYPTAQSSYSEFIRKVERRAS